MVASVAGTYTGGVTTSPGAKSLTNVTIPSGATTALICFSKFISPSGRNLSAITLDSQSASFVNGYTTQGSVSETHVYRASGFSVGASKTLAFTVSSGSADSTDGIAVIIVFLQGEDTASPIQDSDIAGTASAGGTATTPSLTVPSSSLVVSFCTTDDTATPSFGAGQSSIAGPAIGSTGGAAELYATTETLASDGTQSVTGDFVSITAIVVKNADAATVDPGVIFGSATTFGLPGLILG